MISVKKLDFNYKSKPIFTNFDLEIKEKTITTIIGPNGSGKSTLAKILVGLLNFEGNILVNGVELNKENINEIRQQIGVVFENPDNQFIKETVFDEIAFTLNNLNSPTIEEDVHNIARFFNISNLLDCKINNLNTNQKVLVCLASALVHKPKVLILDETLSLIDQLEKDKIIKILKCLKKNGLTIINISHDVEDTLISDNIIIMDKGKIVLKGKKSRIYKNEKLLNSLGYKLPFMVELSNRLIFYGLIDHIIYDMKEMVDELWQ